MIEADKIPECQTWNFQLDNWWMESLDYRYHTIHLNKHTASYLGRERLPANGSLLSGRFLPGTLRLGVEGLRGCWEGGSALFRRKPLSPQTLLGNQRLGGWLRDE